MREMQRGHDASPHWLQASEAGFLDIRSHVEKAAELYSYQSYSDYTHRDKGTNQITKHVVVFNRDFKYHIYCKNRQKFLMLMLGG